MKSADVITDVALTIAAVSSSIAWTLESKANIPRWTIALALVGASVGLLIDQIQS